MHWQWQYQFMSAVLTILTHSVSPALELWCSLSTFIVADKVYGSILHLLVNILERFHDTYAILPRDALNWTILIYIYNILRYNYLTSLNDRQHSSMWWLWWYGNFVIDLWLQVNNRGSGEGLWGASAGSGRHSRVSSTLKRVPKFGCG